MTAVHTPQFKIMKKRLDQMRRKNYWLVEPPNNQVGSTMTLWHGTSPNAANAIVQTQKFIPSASGNLGEGVYMSRNKSLCGMFGSALLQSTVAPGKVVNVTSFVTNWSGDTAFLDEKYSSRGEEWCIRTKNCKSNPGSATISNIKKVI